MAALDGPEAGYLLDLTREFQDAFCPMDADLLAGVAALAERHLGLPVTFSSGSGCTMRSLLKRLRLARQLDVDSRSGITLTSLGMARIKTHFHQHLACPQWIDVLENVREDLFWYADWDGLQFVQPPRAGRS